MTKTRVAVIRGGIGSEYDISLETGKTALLSLPEDKYQPVDVLISRDGAWYVNGWPIRPVDLPEYADVAFIGLHGEFGEDGGIQKILDDIKFPYTGSGHIGSAVGINKDEAKKILKEAGMRVPYGIVIENDMDPVEAARLVFKKVSPTWIIKPNEGGSSIGLSFARTFSELVEGISRAQTFGRVLVEEYLKGKEATCGVIDNFRRQDIYSLLPTEVIRSNSCPVWTYEGKYTESNNSVCPGRFSDKENEELQILARRVHEILNLRHYSRSDFIVTPRGIYVLEVNTLPGLTKTSPMPKALEAIGCSCGQFLDHLVNLALVDKKSMIT